MDADLRFKEFSLLGDPLHRLGGRIALIQNGRSLIAFGVSLGAFLWVVVVLLAFIEGISRNIFSLATIGGHVRLLLAIPLFFLCEALLMPRMTQFVHETIRSKLVPDSALPSLQNDIARIMRWNSSWVPETLCLIAAVVLYFVGSGLSFPGLTAAGSGRVSSDMPLTALWYWLVCLVAFRFLSFRWIWLISLWCFFLWRLSRLPLHLMPAHPDGVAGLGHLEIVHTEFMPLIMAISVVLSASFAEDISTGALAFEAIYIALPLILLVDGVLFLGPLFFFSPILWRAKVRGMVDYGAFSSRYVNDFERKWMSAEGAERKESPLGTSDLQSLADLTNSVEVVRNMRIAPVSVRLVVNLGLAAVLPLSPLLLIQYPAEKLAEMLLKSLLGM